MIQEDGGAHLYPVYGDRIPLLKIDLHVCRLIRCRLGRHRQDEHILPRLIPRILEDTALMGDMEQVSVTAVRLLFRERKGYTVFFCIIEHGLPGIEGPFGVPPRCDDVDGRIQGHVRQLKPHLIVTLAGGPVADCVGFLSLGYLYLSLGDERPRDRCSHKVRAFVDGIGPQHGKHEVADKLFSEVVDVYFGRAGVEGLLLEARQLFFLSHVGRKGNHITSIALLKPRQDDRCIQSPRIGHNHFSNLTHSDFPFLFP